MPTILIPLNSKTPNPMTQSEREIVNMLRVLLNDLPDDTFRTLGTLVEEQRGERWSDMKLLVYLQQAVADINSEPQPTYFDLNAYPPGWKGAIITGGMIFALISEGILQNGEVDFLFNFNDLEEVINFEGYLQDFEHCH